MKFKILFALLIFLIHSGYVNAQNSIDSLKNIIATSKNDTIRIKALLAWDNLIYISNPKLDLELNERVLKLCQSNLKSKKNRAKEILFYKLKLATSLNNLGLIFNDRGMYADAVKYFSKSLKLKEELGDKNGISASLNNIGLVYKDQANYKKAIEYFTRASVIMKEMNDKNGLATSLNNIGIVYQDNDNLIEAEKYYVQSLALSRELQNKSSTAMVLNNLALLFLKQDDIEKALPYCLEGLKLREELGDKAGIAMSLNNLSQIYKGKKEYDKALKFAKASVKLAQEVDALMEEQNSIYSLYEIYSQSGNYKLALDNYILANQLQDSLQNYTNRNALIEQQYQSDYDKKKIADSIRNIGEARIKDSQILAQKTQIKHEQTQRYALYGGIILLLALAILAFRSFMLKKKDNKIIALQKQMVEEKQKEVMDSIHYAKRIQEALMPSEKSIGKKINELKKQEMKSLLFILIIICVFITTNGKSQSKAESLITLIKKDKLDTNKVNHLNDLGKELMYVNPDTSILLSKQALKIATKIKSKKSIANCYNNLGVYNWIKGEFPVSLSYHLKALGIREGIKDKSGTATSLGNIGIVYWSDSDSKKALEYLLRALKLTEELNDKNGIAKNLGNIGVLYDQLDKPKIAISYYLRALKLNQELIEKSREATMLGNLGVAYHKLSNDTTESIKSRDTLQAHALKYYQLALTIENILGNTAQVARHKGNIGALYITLKKYTEAEKYLLDVIAMYEQLNMISEKMQFEFSLSELYSKLGNPTKALEYYKAYDRDSDTLFNIEKNNEATKNVLNYEYEKKESALKAKQEKEAAVAASDKKRQNLFILFLIVIVLAVIVIATITFKSLKNTKKQKSIIELQKLLVEEKQKEVMDSIHYAKRIQQALLPSEKLIEKHMNSLTSKNN